MTLYAPLGPYLRSDTTPTPPSRIIEPPTGNVWPLNGEALCHQSRCRLEAGMNGAMQILPLIEKQ